LRSFAGQLRQEKIGGRASRRRRDWAQQASVVAQQVRAETDAAVKVIAQVITGPPAPMV
jgi:hypothetical protein